MILSISVVIPTYNYGDFIAEAIESTFLQTRKPDEVIVIDDGSTDETEAVVSRFGNTVRYFRRENAGVSAARNEGVARSSGKLIAFMDADDIWEPEKLERQAKIFASDASVGLVHCGMREFDTNSGETISLHTEGMEGLVADDLLLWERPAVNVSGSSIMVDRMAFDAVGGFDTRIKVGEDWDFCYRVAMKYRVGFVPEPLVNYRNHGRAVHRNVKEMERGMGLFYEKAFQTADKRVLSMKRSALGNYHRVLAGSYLHAGQYGEFLRHSLHSIWNKPSGLMYFLQYPVRRLRRR